MQKVGRNKPCPCGSGKKYKNCCWRKDQEESRLLAKAVPNMADYDDAEWDDALDLDDELDLEPIAPSLPDPLPEEDEEPDPLLEALYAFWTAFREAASDEKWQLAEETLTEHPELFDDENTFEVFNALYEETAVSGSQNRFAALVSLLQQQAPDSYEHEAHYLLGWLIENALISADYEAIMPLFNELALLAGDEIDEFNRVEQKLAYHGLLDTLLTGHRLGWPLVQDSSDIVPWGIDEFASRAADYEMFALLRENPTLAANDPVLLGKTELYTTPNAERFSLFIAYLTGKLQPQWTIADLTLAPLPPPSSRKDFWDDDEEDEEETLDPAAENLFLLSVAFMHYLHDDEDVPFTKARLVRSEIMRYFLERHAGELEPVDNPLFSPRRKQRKRRKKSKQKKNRHPLCPDKQTLDRYLSRLMGFMSSQFHVAGAFLECVPAWLRFLEKNQLIDSDQREKTLNELKGLDTDLLKIIETATTDPLLKANTEKWRENAGLA